MIVSTSYYVLFGLAISLSISLPHALPDSHALHSPGFNYICPAKLRGRFSVIALRGCRNHGNAQGRTRGIHPRP